MKFKRLFVILGAAISILTSCGVKKGEQNSSNTASDEKISLNIAQADLIADITDNEKYLNKDLFYSVDTLEDTDSVSVIITLDNEGLSDYYEKSSGYSSLGQYSNSKEGKRITAAMKSEQDSFIDILLEKEYINEVNHSYTTLFNGFSAKTTYAQAKKLEKSNYGCKVTISEAYTEPEYHVTSNSSYEAVTNYVKVYGTGIFDSSGVDYDGENTSVAILDSGFDVHHSVFQNMPNDLMITKDDVASVLKDSKAYGYFGDLKVQDVYLNEKIPFAYDNADKDSDVAPYDSDHGTHVAGIIGGSDDVITGVAVNTQLVLMKVFGDVNNGAVQEDILAALEDAILLGVDAINLSLGSACGFARSSDNEYINVVYDKIEASGISLVVAASNDYSSGYGGENGNTNKASNPDSATVGSPGSFASTISVASISGVKSKYLVDEDGYTFFFNNANNASGEAYDFYDMLFANASSNDNILEVEYVTVPGVGKKVNYSNIDVEGKIALVKRGDTTFQEKAAVALAEGAIGCIIYNNVAGDVFMSAGNDLGLALCSVSKDDGEYLAKRDSGTLILDKTYLAGPFMSEFSSWGPISNLSLKPEITAHGGSILSSVPGGGYEEISGTSMACPNLCGVVILVRQALKERYPDITPVELVNLANKLLMSTATNVLDESGNPYSPRKVGAGLANLEYAIDTLAYLSVDDKTKSKIELGDDPEETGVYELVFDINNISNQELKYNLSNLTMTESLSTSDPMYVAEKAYMLNPNTEIEIEGNGSLSGNTITVNPNETVTVKYTLKLTNQEKRYIRKSFVNGMYVEGFAVLEGVNTDIDLSIPFLAFFGDWTVAPMFDKTYFEVESEAYNGAIDEEDKLKADYYATTPLGTYYHSYIIPLGTYVYEMDESQYDQIPASEEHCAIGYSLETINGITTVYAGLLRNAKKMSTVIINEATGEVVYEHVKYDEHKAYFSGTIIPGYDLINITAAELGLQNNTKYTFKMLAELDYDDGGLSDNLNNTFEFSFYVDFESPIITDAQFYTKYDKTLKEDRYYVDVYVYDNHYAQSIRPFTLIDGELTSLSEYVIPIYGEKGAVNKVTVEITDYMDLLQYGELEGGEYAITNGLGFLVDDYALNQSYSYVTLPGTNTENLTFKEEYITDTSHGISTYKTRLDIGDELDLTKMLETDDPHTEEDEDILASYLGKLKWTSSNESILKVSNGKVEAVGAGTAMITCSTMNTDGYVYSCSLKITVKGRDAEKERQKVEEVEFVYFDVLNAFLDGADQSEIGETGQRKFFTETPNISFYPGEKVQLGYQIQPWNLKDYKLIWSSTNEKVATVDENGVVTALKEGSATITLKVEVDGKISTLMASTRVNVKSEFVVEGNTLIAYKGLGGDVVIPDDEGILYIDSFAFSLYTIDYSIEIEEDDYDSAKTPASNTNVKSVVIPADVKEVRKYAFYNCTGLEKVTFLKNDEGESCPLIREYAFALNENLKEINLEEVGMIGSYAFYKCKSLDNIDISNVFAMGERVFANCESLSYVDITDLRNAGNSVFENCSSLESISNGVFTFFSENMFRNSGITTLEFKADRIPDGCFTNCKSLVNATIVNELVYVGNNAFKGCSALEEVKFNDNAGSEFIYAYAFKDCTSLKVVTLPDSNFILEHNAFEGCELLDTVILNKNTFIEANLGQAFKGCNKLAGFILNSNNEHYQASGNLLLSKDGKEIVLAAPNFEYGDYTVPTGITKISDAAFSSIEKITSLTLNAELEEISSNAFEDCINITKITLVNDLIIGDYAFKGCQALNTIENATVLSTYNKYVFSGCAFEELNLNNVVINEGAFADNKQLTSINITTNELGNKAFEGCSKLLSIAIDAKVIGDYAFRGCNKLTNAVITNNEKIGDYAFMGCNSITEYDLSNTIEIGDYAFADNTLLENVKLDNAEIIGKCAFGYSKAEEIYTAIETEEVLATANALTAISLPNIVELGEYAFSCSFSLANVSLGSKIEEIKPYTFVGCYELLKISADGNIHTIGEAAFAENEKLETVEITGIKDVETAAFYLCRKLSTIDLTNAIVIGEQAFYSCGSLTALDLANVVTIEAGAFLLAEALASINMPKVENIYAQAISCTAVEIIIIPNTIKFIDATAFYYNKSLTQFVDSSLKDTVKVNDYVTLNDGVLYTACENNKFQLSSYPTAKDDQIFEIMFGTVRVEEYAGYFNTKVEKIIFPATIKNIGNMAFYGCTSLNTVEFKSTFAPILEGTISDLNIDYDHDSEIFELLNKYFQFNGYYPLYYGQFKDNIGEALKMNIVISANANKESYNSILYGLYFDVEDMIITDVEELNSKSIDYLDKVVKIPTNVSLSDEKIIQDARTAYNLLDQDLTEYGYSQEYLDSLLANLTAAEDAWLELKMTRVNKIYEYLIEDIKNLGSEYDFNKLSDYYEITKQIELIDRADEKYVDISNVESFEEGFNAYFKDLNDDIGAVTEISKLPTTTVNKVGLAVAITSSVSILGIAIMLIRKRWFI